ncbi:unnamed protein product [Amaranthus hypochondriacus]
MFTRGVQQGGANTTTASFEPPQPQLQPRPQPVLGGYSLIQNLSEPHVIEVARFAIKEHNKMQHKGHMLKFLSIFKGWSQVVAGVNYRLIITAKRLHSRDVAHRYEALVYERPWEHFMNLTSFKMIDQQEIN